MFEFTYYDTIISKNKLKKIFLLKLLTTQSIKISWVMAKPSKNVFLNSPFHYKTVKSHLHIPTAQISIVSPVYLSVSLLGVLKTTAVSKKIALKI